MMRLGQAIKVVFVDDWKAVMCMTEIELYEFSDFWDWRKIENSLFDQLGISLVRFVVCRPVCNPG